MIKADYQTTKNFPFTLNVSYIINYASKIGRIAKKYADAKFSFSGFNDYNAVYAFKSAEVAAECKAAIEKAFEGIKHVSVGDVTDTFMEKVATEIYCLEHEKI